MSAYNIIVNDVQKYKNNILCLARIDNYRNMLRHVSVGESIKTDPIQMDFNDSIGRSNWILIFFPKGQYVCSRNSAIFESGRASMYLKMVNCENQDDSLAMTIKFFIKSPYFEVKDKFASKKDATFLYRDLNRRWIGPMDLESTDELYSKRCESFFVNDSLTIGCELNVALSSHNTRLPTMRWSMGNADNLSRTDNYAESEHTKASLQTKISGRRYSSDLRNDTKFESGKKCTCKHSQINGQNKKIIKGSETWHQKLLQSTNEKIKSNLGSEEPAIETVFQSTTEDTGYRFKVQEAIDFFEKISIVRQ